MFFKDNFKKVGVADIDQLKRKVSEISDEIWMGDSSRQEKFEAHKYTQTIAFIFDEDFRHEDPTTLPYYSEFKELIEPVCKQVSSFYDSTLKAKRLRKKKNKQGYFIRVILVRLLPKGVITPHTDNGYSLSRCHRVHIPIFTSDKTSFFVGEEPKNMKEGEIWEINNRNVHAVKNDSEESRIHLIMDYVLPGECVLDYLDGNLTC
ncbi:MAG: aspartyl/asparaginyl beta-hydroxylase domain-containing protein [Pseudomonadota bacterium]